MGMTRTKPPNPTDVIGNPRGCCCCSGSNPTRPGTLHTSVPGQGRMQAPSLDPLPMTKVSIVRPIRIYAIEPRDPAISPALPLVVVCSKKRLCSEYHIFGTCPHSLAQIPVFLPMPQSTRQTQAQASQRFKDQPSVPIAKGTELDISKQQHSPARDKYSSSSPTASLAS
ncbi:uncharacterized protein FFB14_15252 [Fusarium fujikuroi]|nr:uncharacterized protein FFB14_15252 [Fusarium fujikuroi]